MLLDLRLLSLWINKSGKEIKNKIPQENIPTKQLDDTTLLIKCLTVICRHFDNIESIANYEYISSVILIAVITIQSVN